MKKKKTFCDFSKDEIRENLEEIILLVNEPRYICRKCARVSNTGDHLCKPVKMSL
ncbi:MAG: hypothetical protein JXR65_00260 [Bacteroidales bacterium]|nr:hypothetical protein [Bacteroidales bacterium]